MAREVRHFEVTVSAGTPIGTPARTSITVPVRILRRVDWHLPAGCGGLVGFYLSMGGVQVQPLPAGAFVTGDNKSGTWTLDDQPDSGAWQISAYNTGAHPHLIHLELHLDLVQARTKHKGMWPDVLLSNYSPQLRG